MCGTTENLEAHHLFPKSHGNWIIIYDTDFGVTLCNGLGNDCHQPTPVGSDLFEKVIARVRVKDEARAEKILIRANTPITPYVLPFEAKTVKKILRLQWEDISKDNWMDQDCVPRYGDAR